MVVFLCLFMIEIDVPKRSSISVKYELVRSLPEMVVGIYREALEGVNDELNRSSNPEAAIGGIKNQLSYKKFYGAFLRNDGSFTTILPVKEIDLSTDLETLLETGQTDAKFNVFDDHVISVLNALRSADIEYRGAITPYNRLISLATTHATTLSRDEFSDLVGEKQPEYFSGLNLKFGFLDLGDLLKMGRKKNS